MMRMGILPPFREATYLITRHAVCNLEIIIIPDCYCCVLSRTNLITELPTDASVYARNPTPS
jgi:hypothetical protein